MFAIIIQTLTLQKSQPIIKTLVMDQRLNEVLDKIKESSECQDIKAPPPSLTSDQIQELYQIMKNLNDDYSKKKGKIEKMQKIDGIVNSICTGGKLNDTLKSLMSLTDSRDITVGNAIIRIISQYFNYVVWYSLLCDNIKTGDDDQLKFRPFRKGIKLIQRCIKGQNKYDPQDGKFQQFYSDQGILAIIDKIEKLKQNTYQQQRIPDKQQDDKQKQKHQAHIKELTNKIQCLQKSIEYLQKTNQQQQIEIKIFNQRDLDHKTLQIENENKIKSLKLENIELQFKIGALQKIKGQKYFLDIQLQNLQKQKINLKDQVNELNKKIKQYSGLESQKRNLQVYNKQLEDQVKKLKSINVKDFGAEIQSLATIKEEKRRLQNQIEGMLATISSKKQEIETQKQKLNQIQIQSQQLAKSLEDLNKGKRLTQENVENFDIQQQKYDKLIRELTANKQKIQEEIKKLNDAQKEGGNNQHKNITQPTTIQQFSSSGLLFLSDIILGYEIHSLAKPVRNYLRERDHLVQVLEKYCKKTIARTKLLFQHDDRNLLNFHEYVDGVDNYVVLTKLENDNLIAAYSQNKLDQHVANNGPSFISSLTRGLTVYLEPSLKGSRATSYNPYYIIFGNDEFRMHPAKKEVLSYLGYQYSYFRPKCAPAELIGIKAEAVSFKSFEVHKVFFEGED